MFAPGRNGNDRFRPKAGLLAISAALVAARAKLQKALVLRHAGGDC
jgi:hypothetical protein